MTSDIIEKMQICIDDIRKFFEQQPTVMEIDSPTIYVVGDIHGDIDSFSSIKKFINELKSNEKVIFLGDYVDRGGHSTEVICGLLELAISLQEKIILLRGNHETAPVNLHYGFYSELVKKYGDAGKDLYFKFNDLFAQFPIAALVNGEIFLVHGGIAKTTSRLGDIKKLNKGDPEAKNPTLLQLLWNDPTEDVKDWAPSPRGHGIYLYGEDPFNEFLETNDISFMVRAHSFFVEGFRYYFNKRLLSLFSPINYVGYIVNGKIAKIHNNKIELIDIIRL